MDTVLANAPVVLAWLLTTLACLVAGMALVEGRYQAVALPVLPSDGAAPPRTVAGPSLTPREIEVLRLVAAGRSDKEVAQALAISPRTVGRHLENARAKLGADSRAAAAALAVRRGLV